MSLSVVHFGVVDRSVGVGVEVKRFEMLGADWVHYLVEFGLVSVSVGIRLVHVGTRMAEIEFLGDIRI